RGLVGRQFHVRRDPTPTIHRASPIRELDFVVRIIVLALAVVIVIVQRLVGVIALDQASAGGVVLRGGEGQAGIFRQRIHGLHQALAERDFANDQAAIVVLNGSGDNFGGGGGAAIDQHHQRIILASIAVGRYVALFGGRAAVVGNDQLSLLEKFVGYADALAEQASGILAQIEDQAFQIAHLVERIGYFMLGGFLETGDVQVSDAGLDHEMEVDAIARNLVADDGEFDGVVGTFAQHGDADGGTFRSLEQIGYVRGAHVVGGLAVDGGDDVAGANAGAIGRRADEGSDDDNLIIAGADGHSDAVILA